MFPRSKYSDDVVSMAMAGKTTREIADALGITYNYAYSITSAAIRRGQLPPRKKKKERLTADMLYRKFRLPLGMLGPEINKMSEDVLVYWTEEALEGQYACFAEMVADVLVDEYFRRRAPAQEVLR